MKSREHVTTNGRAVFFAAMWEDLKNAALSHGWALGLHGSLANDMDIMAMPWDEHANSVDAMIAQLCICFTESAQIEKNIKVTTDKPNNRTVYTLPIWADFYLDINVIGTSSQPSEQKPPERHYAVLEDVSKGAEEMAKKIIAQIRKGSYEDWVKVISENIEQSMKQERDRAIQECIEVLNEHHDTLPLAKSESDNGYSIAFANAVNILEKLKK